MDKINIIKRIVAVILVLAMVIPMGLSILFYFFR